MDFINLEQEIFTKAPRLFANRIHFTPDGEVHRFATAEKPHKENGWYIAQYNEFDKYIIVGDWQTEQRYYVNEKTETSNFSDPNYRQKIEQYVAEKLAKQEELHKNAAERSVIFLNNAVTETPKDFPYIVKKQILPSNIKFDNNYNCILVPIYNIEKSIVGLQRIFADGKKRFTDGMQLKSNFGIIGFSIDFLYEQKEVYVCEGYATGNSIWQATNKPVIIAFDCGNIFNVVKLLRDFIVNLNITICADNDQFNLKNVGVEHANKTAQTYNCAVKIPNFIDLATKPTDFNDLHCLSGLQEVLNQLLVTIELKEEDLEIDYLSDVDYIINSKEYNSSKYDKFCHNSIPKILLNPPKNIDMLLDFIVDRSPCPQILLSIINILSVIGTLAGHRIRLKDNRGDLRTNFYSIGICPSSHGKDGSKVAFDKIKSICKLDYLFATGVKSDAAIVQGLKDANGRLVIIKDEIGDFLGGLKHASNPYQLNILGLLKTLFTSSTDKYVSEKKKTEEDITIEQPVLSVYGMTTEERFLDSLSVGTSLDGFLSRFVVIRTEPFKGENDVGTRYGDIDLIPQHILDYVNSIENMPLNGVNNDSKNVTLDNAGKLIIQPNSAIMNEEAKKMLREFELFIKKEQQELEDNGKWGLSSISGRSVLKVKKVALISCIDPTKKEQEINVEDIRYAIALVRFSDKVMYEMVNYSIVDTIFQRNCKELYKIIRQFCYKNKRMINRTELNEILNNKFDKKSVDICLDSLIESKDIKKEVIENIYYYYPIIKKEGK